MNCTLPLVLTFILGPAAAAAAEPPLAPLSWLAGEWSGEGTGAPGQAKGGFRFTFELQDRVLVRRSFAEYPAANGRPVSRHDDLMIFHRDDSGALRADYYDNEGHVIRYAVTAENNVVRCLSDTVPAAPRFRFTYTRGGSDTLRLKFEIAPPGKPEAFSTYIEAAARRAATP